MNEQDYLAQFSGEEITDDNGTFTIETDEDMRRFEAMINHKWHEEHDPFLLEKTADD